ncbi:MAG TPA: short-chain dehydrogenase [Candidatus Kapabacteria bacterium]|nr:short-chain dehydrogenase [Candidatus Kapabacteria bacterium]
MDIAGKTVLVLGGWGLVGSAVCRKLLAEKPARIIVTSLAQAEADEAADELRSLLKPIDQTTIVPWAGNVFGRDEHRFRSREELLADPHIRPLLIADIVNDLSEELLAGSALYRLLVDHNVDAVIDCVNTATAIAYQDIFSSSRAVMKAFERGEGEREVVERLLATQYIPQLIRHVQILARGLKDCSAKAYIKIGTVGSGGMGLNIPYTHSEERPSRVLLSKTSVAGAHTLLLFLMGRTPDGPIIKEIKPTATIAWKRIEHGEVRRRGRAIPLVDCGEHGVTLDGRLRLTDADCSAPTGRNLTAPFIDTGENGIFSRGEFEAISSLQQMEMITPEEIADHVVFELKGGNTGHDVINALDGAVFGPTYRGGVLRSRAVERLARLEAESGIPSVAFEMLGPPRLSKLLYEAHILGLVGGSVRSVIDADAAQMSEAAAALLRANADLRSRIISIGIPVLMPDGVTLLRGEKIAIPPFRGETELDVTSAHVDEWASAGWVDLRVENIIAWQARLRRIHEETMSGSPDDTSSRTQFTLDHWENFDAVPIGKIAAWIFTVEDEGARMKA